MISVKSASLLKEETRCIFIILNITSDNLQRL